MPHHKTYLSPILKIHLVLIFSLVFLLSACGPEKPSEPSPSSVPEMNTLSAEEKEAGWRLLFDGISFAGWRGIGQESIPEGHWTIEDGAIKKISSGEVPLQADGQPLQGGDIMSADTFEDFELYLEWKISPGGNSGVKYNVSEEMSMSYPPNHAALGFEYQVLDDALHPDGRKEPRYSAGGLYDLVGPENKTLKPIGEYNSARIVFQGRHGEHWLNGVKVLEYDLDTEDFQGHIAQSKFKNIPGFSQKRKGHIVLQDHTHAVWYRNIKILKIK